MPQRAASLETYDRKRDFKKTAEPPGVVERSGGELHFVIQKHDASRLHYDLRLEMNGVYKSWAVPKGPSLDPKDRRMAVETEDHPIAYGTFEGTIPKGEYGGGTVLLWDKGTFIPEGDPLAAYEKGHLAFRLEGEKLHGRFHLVRMKNKGEKQTSWLLFKSKDEHAKPGFGVDKLVEASVKTGRSLAEIAQVGEEEGSMPSVIEPELCKLVDEPPRGDDWIHEPKIDGYRVMVRKEGRDVQLFTRGGLDWTDRFPEVADAARELPVGNVILDGEVAVLDEAGDVKFEALQRALSTGGSTEGMVCYLFDCLFLEGQDLRAMPLLARKQVLFALLAAASDTSAAGTLVPVPHHEGDPAPFLAKMEKQGIEGIVSKRKDSPYRSGRGDDWRKVKLTTRQELVVIGFADSDTGPKRIGALLVAARADDGALVFVGKVGTGFTAKDKRSLYDLLAPIQRDSPPVQPRPKVTGSGRVHWVEPKVVVEVAYGSVTRDGILRHASYQGLRYDKDAHDVPADRPASEPADPPPKQRTAAKRVHTARTKPAPDATARSSATTGTHNSKPAQRLPRGAIEVLGVKVTSADRVIYDGDIDITKGMLAEYIAAVAPLMLPFVERRPLSVVRCPSGSKGHCFFQKHTGQGMPDSVKSIVVPEGLSSKEDDDNVALAVDDAAGLVGLVQMGVLEIHPWGAAPGDPESPDRIIFDLDPADGLEWKNVCGAARDVRERLKRDGLVAFVKSTGGKGLHVEVPLGTGVDTWDDVKSYALEVAARMAKESPALYTDNMRKDVRKGRIFIDYLRNGRGATAIAPYSMRAKQPAVAVPLNWEELDDFEPGSVTVLNLHERFMQQKRKPWARYLTTKQALPK